MAKSLPKPNNIRNSTNNNDRCINFSINPMKLICLLYIIFHLSKAIIAHNYPRILITHFYQVAPDANYFKIFKFHAFCEGLYIIFYVQILLQFDIVKTKRLFASLIINDFFKFSILIFLLKSDFKTILIVCMTSFSMLVKIFLLIK